MLKNDITCLMPQGILSIEVPIMVFQIMKLKQSGSGEGALLRRRFHWDGEPAAPHALGLRPAADGRPTHMVTRLLFFPDPSEQLWSL